MKAKIRKLFGIGLIILAILLSGCVHQVDSELSQELQKEHELRKMFEKDVKSSESSSSWGGGFFMFIGAAGGSSQSSSMEFTMIRFAWKDADGSYIISELPLNKIRVNIVEGNVTPKIKFYMKSKPGYTEDYDYVGDVPITKQIFNDDPEKFWKNYLAYAVIVTSAKDWPENIKLPMNT